MFVTDRFVFLHLPKTGGTFVSTLLGRIHEARGDEVRTVWLDPANGADLPAPYPGRVLRVMLSMRNQHGTRRDVPASCQGLPLVATIRNPYDRYPSQFAFAWWRQVPEMFGPVEQIRRHYPAYPDLRFEEFVRLANTASIHHLCEADPDRTPGLHTQQFVDSFFRDPASAYPRLCTADETDESLPDEFRDIRFLDQAHLNRDLHDLLIETGYAPAEARTVLDAGRIWPPEGGRSPDDGWSQYYSSDLKAYVRHRERFLFRWFPQFDV